MKERGRMDEGNEEGGDTQRKRKKELVRDREGRRGKGKGGEEFRSLKGGGKKLERCGGHGADLPFQPPPLHPLSPQPTSGFLRTDRFYRQVSP